MFLSPLFIYGAMHKLASFTCFCTPFCPAVFYFPSLFRPLKGDLQFIYLLL